MPDSVRKYSCSKRNFKKKKKGSDTSTISASEFCKKYKSATLWKELAKCYPELRRRLDNADQESPVPNGRITTEFSANTGNSNQSRSAVRRQGRARAYTAVAAIGASYQNSPKRQRSSAKRVAVRRGTQSLTSMAVRKTPILPARRISDDHNITISATTGRKISVAQPVKRARRSSEVYRRAEDYVFDDEPMDDFYEDDNGDHVWCSIYLDEIPYLFTTNGKWRKTSTFAAPGKSIQANGYRRRLSTTGALLPGANKIKLQELAKDELLASLNEPFDKEVPEQDGTDDEKDVVDYAPIEEEDELLKLTELKRVKVIEEIFETEKKYICCLDTVDKVFRAPMLQGGIAQEKEINALFPNCLSTIKECHSWFMEQLENRMNCEEWQGSIGDILGKMAGPLKDNLLNVYTDYVNAFPKSISTFSKCTRTSQKFRKFIENCFDKSDNLDLPSYLITPVQRLPRYVLLLRQLSKYTRDDHPDNDSIKSALLQMEELIRSLNGSITSSMYLYTARESENRKSIKRQLSRRRKKPRPATLNLSYRDSKIVENEKPEKPNGNNNSTPRHSQNCIPRISPDIEEYPSIQEENKENEDDQNKKSQSCNLNSTSTLPLQQQLRPPSPVTLRKNKSDNRKSLRRSIGAALSSFWSPKDERDLKNIHDKFVDQSTKESNSEITTSSNSRRKYGVSYVPASLSVSEETTPSKTSEDGIKRRRFSNSFRERTRSFRIQMRRRSGTWFSTTEEHRTSDLNLDYVSASTPEPAFLTPERKITSECSTVSPNQSSKNRNSKGSSLISLFSKRKPKLVSDEHVPRRRSDSDREFNLANNAEHKTLSMSISVPNFPQRKDSKAFSISSSICEESLGSDSEQQCTSLSTIEDETTRDEASEYDLNGHVNGHDTETVTELKLSENLTKKPKKGKIMKTLRHIMGKGKN